MAVAIPACAARHIASRGGVEADLESGANRCERRVVGHAVISGSWASQVPAIKHGLGLSDSQLDLALFGMALGT